MNIKSWFFKTTLLVLVMFSMFSAYQPARVEAATPAAVNQACRSSLWMTAHVRPGYIWEQHRYYLESNGAYNGSRYVIVDMRTYEAYSDTEWLKQGLTPTSHVMVGVRTRYVFTHLWWSSDPWLLLYNC